MRVEIDPSQGEEGRLTFGYLRGMSPPRRPDEIPGMRSSDGGWTSLAELMSDQCPRGILVRYPDGTEERFGGSVASQVPAAKAAIHLHNPKIDVAGSSKPVDKFPRVAVREALVNAVAHRDYGESGDIVVTIGERTMEIVSPGTAFTAGDGVRNPGLVRAMELLKIKGYMTRGLKLIHRAYAKSGLRPRIVSGRDSFTVILPAVESVRGPYEAKVVKLTEHMKRTGGVTLEEICRVLRLSHNYTAKIVDRMVSDGLIFSMYAGRMRRYFLCDTSVDFTGWKADGGEEADEGRDREIGHPDTPSS